MPGLVCALPTGGSVAQGSATIGNTATQTTVTQTTPKAVINWTGFNSTNGQTVQFVDPDSSSITLNRINSAAATSFSGQLLSNGNVWLINPRGIAFNGTAQVNVGGLLATTSNIADSDFMAGNYNFTPGDGAKSARVFNQGHITVANAGLAALVSPNVANNGTITANLSKITLAAGDTYGVDLAGDGLINLQAGPAVTQLTMTNTGTLNSAGGSVVITAAQASALLNNVINLAGVINADNLDASNKGGDLTYGAKFLQSQGGTLTLDAYRNVKLNPGVKIAAASTATGGLNVTLDANDTGAAGGGAVNVSSTVSITTNGGNITMGGGGDPTTGSAVGNKFDTNGVLIGSSAQFHSGGGNITMNGTGANAAGTVDGVNIGNAVLDNGTGGLITIIGNGGATTGGASNGIAIASNAQIGVETGGAVTLNGTGGTAKNFAADGVVAGSASAITGNSLISIIGGAGNSPGKQAEGIVFTSNSLGDGFNNLNSSISLNGTGGTGLTAAGVDLVSAQIGSNNGLAITGQGGNAAAGGSDVGVSIIGTQSAPSRLGGSPLFISGTGGSSAGSPKTGAGVLISNTQADFVGGGISGTGANSSALNNYGIQFAGNDSISGQSAFVPPSFTVTGTGHGGAADLEFDNSALGANSRFGGNGVSSDNLSIIADTINVNSGVGPSAIFLSSNNLTIEPRDPSTTIGVAGGAGTLNISSAILNNINIEGGKNTVTIGSTADTGTMIIGANNCKNTSGPGYNVSFLNGSGDIDLTGVNTTVAGSAFTLATLSGNFVNTGGSGALAPGAGGRYLVYTNDPSRDSLDGLTPDFQQHGCAYGAPCPGLPPTGNGLVFAAP
jgi:filamentous hemagglutinin family protein